jgi:peroxiredoxin
LRSDVVPGAPFPDFELIDHLGQPRRLSALQREHPYLRQDNPMIVVLARGHFCAKDQQQHHDLVAFYPKITVGYAQLVTIMPDPLARVQDFREGVGARWTFLADEERTVQETLQIQEYTDPVHRPQIPYTFVLEPGLRIYKIYNGYWFWGRPTTNELWLDLRAIGERLRPDWDLGAPGLREAWEAGDRTRFYPYGGARWWARAPADAEAPH